MPRAFVVPRVATDAEYVFYRISVDIKTRCWNWLGYHNRGYGRCRRGGPEMQAHRLSYETFAGPIPEGLQLDHLCRNPSCVNPAHLEPVTSRENTLRGISPMAKNAVKKACPLGHAYEVRLFRGKTGRFCRTCKNNQRNEAYRAASASRRRAAC